MMVVVMTLAPCVAFAQSVPAGTTQIIPDGRTATSVATSGSVTNITTSTISGGNAFNSFSQFKTGTGTTTNLQVPSNASNLINVVRDGTTVIDGTLNSYKNGQIGGNVYFADPYGFVVGKSGTVNVGSLNVSTPSKQFIDGVIGPQGQINGAATNQLINGDFPLSPDGHIAIHGRINAQDGVRLIGQSVVVGAGGNPRDIARQDHAAKFAATVNSKGLRSASGIVVRNGSIQIVAGGSARINGRLAAGGHKGRNGGTISVAAGKDISVGSRATLSTASKAGNGGDITFKAAGDLTVKPGATFDTSSQQGNAGNIELSAKNTVSLASAIYNLSAPNGRAGTLLVDPTDIVINAGNSMVTLGGSVNLVADNSITIASDGIIDTRNFNHSAGALSTSNISLGNSGNVTLTAPSISVAGKILTETTSGFSAGDVMLVASASMNIPEGPASATTGINVTGTITGKTIQLLASSSAISSFLDSSGGIAALVGQSVLGAALGLAGGYLASTANSTVTIGSGAHISATGNVTLSATGQEIVSDPAISLSLLSPAAIAVVVAELNANIAVHVTSGASVTSGGDLTIKANNTATLGISAIAASFQSIVANAVAYTSANVQTSAKVDSGATIVAGSSNNTITVLAHNQNSFSTTATAAALGSGAAGFAVAYSDVTTSATANFGANLGTSANPSSANLIVAAVADADASAPKDVTSASAAVGNPALVSKLLSVAGSASPAFLDKLLNSGGNPFSSDVKLAGAVAYGQISHSASASIDATNGLNGPPAIYTTGNVAVVSRVLDAGVRNNADSSTSSEEKPSTTSSQGEALISVAAGVSIGRYTHNSNAYIGSGATVSAKNIGVSASTEMPITITWLTYDNLGTWLGKLNGNLGVVNEVLTTYANAATEAKDLGLAGSFNYFSVTNTTTAWVGTNSTLIQSGGSAPWSVTPVSGTTVNFANAVTVQANTYTTSIDMGGNISWFGLTGNSGQNQGGASNATSVGASATVVSYDSNTIAGIADGAHVTSSAGVDVEAKNTSLVIAVAPTSGAGGATGINGIVALLMLDDTTHASISNKAVIDASSVTVNAADALSTFVIAGAVGASQNNAVGVAVGYSSLTTDTAAYVGANSSDISGSANAADDPGATGLSSTPGSLHADTLTVNATTYGIATAASVAATLASSTPSMGSTFLGKFLSVTDISAYGAKASGQTGPPPSFSLSLSGSSSVVVSAMTTKAYIDGASLDRHSATGGMAVDVQAVNNTILQIGAGSAALDFATNPATQSAAVAGAVAVGISDNMTTAYVKNTTALDGDSLSVLALAGGQSTIVALGLAINGSANQSAAASVAGSVSIGDIHDSVTAYVSNSSFGADTSSTRHLADGATVAAYQTTDVGIGGGALYGGGKAGFGFAFTYVNIADPSGGKAVNAYVSNSSITDYYNFNLSAVDSSRIASGAALAGFAQNGLAVSLVVNEINPTISAVIDSGAGGSGFSTIRVTGQNETYTITDTYYVNVTGTVAPVDTADTHYVLQYAFDLPVFGGPPQHISNYLVTHTSIGTAHGDVTVTTGGNRNATFDAAIMSAANPGGVVGTSKIDFSGGAVQAASSTVGASIISVAGVIQGGQNSLGFAVIANTVGITQVAQIAHNVNITATNGDVIVASDNGVNILGVAVGAALSVGTFAGLASSSTNLISNSVVARIGDGSATPSNTQVSAKNLTVQATDNSIIRGAAGTLAIGTGSAAAGLSIVYDSIGNNVTAEISGAKVITSQDVKVVAASNAAILTISLGVALASSVGIAGSVATSILGTNVTADITGGADVSATGNVLVQATNTDTIQVIAGAAGVGLNAAGVGISVVVNDVGGSTSAYISGSGTQVDAAGTASGTFNVNDGVLNNGGFNLSTADNPSAALPDLSEQQHALKGLAVVASSHQAIVADAVTLGLSIEPITGDALALVPVTNLMSGTTAAYIDSAKIDTRLTTAAAGGLPEVYVGASSQTYSRNLVIAAAGSLGISGAGAASATRLERTTNAYMNGATVGGTVTGGAQKVGAITINAASTQVSSNVVVGFAVGLAGGAASVLVNTFAADTEAYADGGTLNGTTLVVNATSTNGYFAAAGAGAAGLIGVAGAFVVGVSNNTTRAYIGDTGQTTTLNLASTLSVVAVSNNTFNSYAIGGALGGTTGVAAMGDFTVINNTTEAELIKVADTQAAGTTTVTATENINVNPTTGAGALATMGNGVGAGANVVLLKSQVAATVLNSAISTTGAVTVAATSNKDIAATTVTLGVGSSVGIGAATGVILIGSTAPGDASSQLAGTVSAVDSSTNGPAPGNGIKSNNVPGNNQPAANKPAPFSIASTLGSASDAVTAEITGGSTAGSSVSVTATANISTSNIASGVGAGAGAAGVGAAVAFTRVTDTVTASLTGNVTTSQASVSATMADGSGGRAVNIQASAGAGGLGAGIGAAVADGAENNTVTANLGGTITGNNTNTASVAAEDSSTVKTQAIGATVGGGAAIGASVAVSSKTTNVSALVAASTTIANYNGLTVSADERGTVDAQAIAGAGGLAFAGTGAGATANDSGTVNARIGHDSVLTIGSGDILVAADATPQAGADAVGVAVAGGVGIGASVALTTVTPLTTAAIEDSTTIHNAPSATADVTVRARNNHPSSGNSAASTAIAAGGGLLLGANATVSTAQNNGQATASIGNSLSLGNVSGATMTAIGALSIIASNTTDQFATTTGVSAGYYAVGFNMSSAGSNTATSATLGNTGAINAASLNVSATGNDSNDANSVAGTGGVYAGNAATSSTSATSTTTASIGSSDATHFYNVAGGLTVAAAHTTNFDGSTNSVNASLAGGSGAFLSHSVNSTVSATIGDSAIIRAANFALTATNTTTHTFSDETNPDNAAWNLQSGSGGLLNLPAGKMEIDVTHNTTATIGNNEDIHILAPASGNSTFKIEAVNNITVHDKAKLDSGGAVAIADTQAFINVTNNATVAIGRADNTLSNIILDAGDIQIGAWTTVNLDLRVASTTWGLAGAPTGTANITYVGTNETDVRRNTRLEATTGALTLAAGDSPDGLTASTIGANATVDLFNKTAIPIPTPPNPQVSINSIANVNIDNSGTAANAGVRSAGDMAIYADRGTITMNAVGTGKDIYREALAATASAVSNLFGGGDITFDYHGGKTSQSGLAKVNIDGIVLTGIQRTRFLTISYDFDPNNPNNPYASQGLLFDSNGITFTQQQGLTVSTAILVRLAQLQNLLSQYAADPIAAGAYASEILFLKQKLVAMGLATGDPTGNDAAHPYVIGAWAQSIQQAYANLQRDTTLMSSGLSGVITATPTLLTQTLNVVTASGSAKSSGDTIVGKWGDSNTFDTDAWLAAQMVSNMTGLSNWSTAAASTAYTNLNTAITNATNASSTLAGHVTTLNTYLSNLTGYKNTIAAMKADLDTQNGIVVSASSTQASIDAAYLAIKNDMATLNTALTNASTTIGQISSQYATVQADVASLKGYVAQVQTNLQSLQTQATTTGNSSAATADAAINANNLAPKFAKLASNISDVDTANSNISSQVTATNSAITAFGTFTASPTANGPAGQFSYYSSDYTSNYTNRYAVDSLAVQNASSTLTNSGIIINDVVAKLGNLNIKADQLTGTGQLQAPGDAQINIVNNTANMLVVNNLTINSDSGGRLRFNGVLVNSNNDINALNRGGTGASFSNVVTGATQAALGIFPSISIQSNYQPDTNDPTVRTVPLAQSANNNLPAPDIQLAQGSVISNPLGSVTIQSQAGNIYSNGQINANTVTINVKNGDFVQSYVFGFDHIAGDPAGTGLNGGDPTLDATGGGIVANGAVFISARYLNINGLIQSGIDQWTLNLAGSPTLTASAAQLGIDLTQAIGTYQTNGNLPVTIAVMRNGQSYNVVYNGQPGQVQFSSAFAIADYTSGTSQVANGLYKVLQTSGNNLGASYDAAHNQFVADATSVLGGYVQLYGQIMNTSPTVGRIRVLDGFGQINITNTTGLGLVLNTLDTGQDPSGVGRGVAGVIDITNVSVNQATNAVSAVHTVYTRNSALNEIYVDTTTGTLNSLGQTVGTSVRTIASGDGRNTTYTLTPGLRYVYTTGTDQSTVTYLEYHGVQLFGTSSLTIDTTVTPQSTDGPHTLSTYRISNGTYIKIDTASDTSARVTDTTTHTTGTTYVKTAEWTDCNWWTLCTSQDHYTDVTKTQYNTVVTTNSLKANYPIAIQFGGSDTGAVNVTSSSAVTLNGVINNKNGTTSISGSSITQNDPSKVISSKDISLTATNGSVGSLGGATTAAKPIQIDLTNGGALTASATNGNVVVNANRDLRVATIMANGDPTNMQARVVLTAGGDILAKDATSYIEAANISLTASNGAIGTSSTPLTLHLGDVDTTSGFVGYYGLTATAANDINIKETSWSGNTNGDMLLNTVTSLGGDVTLTAPGRIIDNNPIQSIDTRTFDQLLAYWNTLGLIDGSANNQAKQNAAILTFQVGRTSDYQTYWQIRMTQADGGATLDPNFHYVASAAEQTLLTQQGINVASYEATRTAQYLALNAEVGSYTTTYNASFHYTISPTETTALLNGASWTQRELAFSLSPGALKTITGTNPIIKEANVTGRTVTLNAGMGLGQALAPVTLDTRTIPTDLHNLTDAQKAAMVAIAAAERSDFFNLSDPNIISVIPKQPLNFAASVGLNVNVTPVLVPSQPDIGTVYLSSLGDALLGNINVSGETRIKVRGSIVNETPTSAAINTGDLILEASGGGIGLIANPTTGAYDDKPLRLALASGKTLVARAYAGIDITSAASLLIDTIYSPNDIKLTSTAGSLLNANNDQLINILGSVVTLSALQGAIGAVGHALNVGNNVGGGVIADASLINLYGPQGYQLILRHLVSAADVTVVAALDATIDGVVTSAGRLEFDVAGLLAMTSNAVVTSTAGAVAINTSFSPLPATSQLAMAAGSQVSAATGITIVTGGDATAASLQASTGNISMTSGGAASITSANAAAGQVDVTADSLSMGAGSQMSGALGVKVVTATDAQLTTLSSTTGDISVTAGRDATIVTASISDATQGKITYHAGRDLAVGSASSAGPVQATAGGAFVETAGGQIVSRTASITVTADTITMGQQAKMIAAASIALQASRDVTLGALVSTANPAPNAAPVISVIAGSPTVPGAIISNNDGQTNITTVRPNASILLTAGGGIGVDSVLSPPATPSVTPTPITVNVPILSASTTTGDINISGIGDLKVARADAQQGNINLVTTGALSIDHLLAKTLTLNSPGDLTIGELDIIKSVTLGGKTITANIVQVPGSPPPLQVNLTGPNGGIAQNVAVNINAPGGTNFGSLFAVDAVIATNGSHIDIANGFVPGQMVLTMPGQNILLNNRSPVPTLGPTVQLYGPNVPFTLAQDGNATVTSGFIVSYGDLAQVTALSMFQGMSFVRDFPRDMRGGDPFNVQPGAKTGTTFYVLGISPSFMLDAYAIPTPVESLVSGPAVNLDGLQ